MNPKNPNVPLGFCACGCGEKAPPARWTDRRRGTVKGEPVPYIQGHSSRRGTPAQRFWKKVRKASGDGCWEWTACLNQAGYGQFNLGGVGKGLILAHRFAWEEANGPIPEGLYCCHKCDNPACVRPDHIFLGTIADNQRDMARKGRSNQGERLTWFVKLTESDVLEIRRRYNAGGVSQRELAKEFGVGRANVGYIVTGKSWAHLPLDPP